MTGARARQVVVDGALVTVRAASRAGAGLWRAIDAEDIALVLGLALVGWGVAGWRSPAVAACVVGGVIVGLVLVRLVLSVWIEIAAPRGRTEGGS